MPAPKVPAILRECVADWLETGNLSEVCRRHNLVNSTLARWVKRPIWAELESELTANLRAETKATYHRSLSKTLAQIEQRLEHGDVVALKGGQLVTIPVRARDLTLLANMLFDKLRLIEGKATKITQGETKVAQLLSEFKQMGQAYRTGTVLDGTSTEVRQEEDGQGSLPDPVEGQIQSSPKVRNPPSPATPTPPMPLLLQNHKPIPNPPKGRVKAKIEDYKATE